MTQPLPTLAETKAMAKALRKRLTSEGIVVGHSQALEKVAQGYGYRDWNALHAAIESQHKLNWVVGTRVKGRYLSLPFAATVRSSYQFRPGWYRLVLDLDQAVDVVHFDSFSNLRKQIRVEVGPLGHSKERTSDGKPQVEIDQ